MSKPLSRAAWESLHALRHASASAAATSRFSTQLQPICSSEHPSQDYGRVLVTDAAEGVEYKGLFDRNLPLGPYEVLLSLQLKKDMQVTRVSQAERTISMRCHLSARADCLGLLPAWMVPLATATGWVVLMCPLPVSRFLQRVVNSTALVRHCSMSDCSLFHPCHSFAELAMHSEDRECTGMIPLQPTKH